MGLGCRSASVLAQRIGLIDSLADVSKGMQGRRLVLRGAMRYVPNQPFEHFGMCVLNQSDRPGCATTAGLIIIYQELAQRGERLLGFVADVAK